MRTKLGVLYSPVAHGLHPDKRLSRTLDAASLELGSILTAWRGAIRARMSVHKSSQAMRCVAARYCE